MAKQLAIENVRKQTEYSTGRNLKNCTTSKLKILDQEISHNNLKKEFLF
jgi:hypothetical protein